MRLRFTGPKGFLILLACLVLASILTACIPSFPSAGPLPSSTMAATAAPLGTDAVGGEPLEAYVLDVGQGDCIFLRSPNGKTMLVDAGENKAFERIDAFLKAQKVARLDVVIATHPHSDHIGGMKKVIEAYEIGAFYMPEVIHDTATFEKMLLALAEQGVPCAYLAAEDGSYLEWDPSVEVSVLSPCSGVNYDDLNDWSCMVRVRYGDNAILLTGDAETHAEKMALSRFPKECFRADVLKLGHHGSSTSTSRAFLEAVNPTAAIASLGEDNSYGHPHRETVQLLKEAGIEFYRTDQDGTISVTLSGTKVQIAREN